MSKTSKAKLDAIARWDKKCSRGIYLKFNLDYDADILEKLDSIPPGDGGKQGYIKKLIRDDIAKGGDSMTVRIREIWGDMPFDSDGRHATGREVWRQAAAGNWVWMPEFEGDETEDLPTTEPFPDDADDFED